MPNRENQISKNEIIIFFEKKNNAQNKVDISFRVEVTIYKLIFIKNFLKENFLNNLRYSYHV